MRHPTPSDGRSRRLALIVLCAGLLMIILDGTIVTVALPAIQEDLGFISANLAWVVNAYTIAFGGLLLLAGRLGDLLGRRRVYLAGMAVFTLASLLCGLSGSAAALIAARFLQGAGGAMASAVSLGMIVTLFPEPRERAKAIGAFSFVGAAGASIGLVLGGVLTQVAGWHWIFLVNLPIGLATFVLARRVLAPDTGLGLRAGADAAGALLVTAGLMLGVYTIVETSRFGWGSARTLGFGALSILLLAAFFVRQATAARPLLPPRVLRSRAVAGANLVQMLTVAAMFSFQFHVALFLRNVLGYGAAETGLAMFPTAVVIGSVSLLLSARLNARFGERPVLLTGLAVLAAGLALLTRVPADASYVAQVLPIMLLIGGFGLALPALTTIGMSTATESDAGLVSGLFNTTQQVGGALGLAALATLSTARADALLDAGRPAAEALASGYRLAFGIGAALLAAAFALSVAILRRRADTQPAVTSEENVAEARTR